MLNEKISSVRLFHGFTSPLFQKSQIFVEGVEQHIDGTDGDLCLRTGQRRKTERVAGGGQRQHRDDVVVRFKNNLQRGAMSVR